MHMVGDPVTMQAQAHYTDVTAQVLDYLCQRVRALRQAGMDTVRMVLDPGIGFGKTPAHNLALLREQTQLLSLGLPVLVGWSRKSTLGVVTGKPVEERLAASLAAALIGVSKGARIVRVHDVAETVDALKVWCAVDNSPTPDSNEHNNAAP
jgi:dihydropteroate synthase